MKTVGKFTFDGTHLVGPAAYLEERGNALIDRVSAGQDVTFNMTAHLSPDPVTALLVRLQTDNAGWLGEKEMLGWLVEK
jgi:hypothetical protein